MKKILLALVFLPTFSFADRLGSLRSNADVMLTTQAVTGASSLEVIFGTSRSSPTATIKALSPFSGSVSGSTITLSVDYSSFTMLGNTGVILNQDSLQSNATFYVSSGTVQNNLTVSSQAYVNYKGLGEAPLCVNITTGAAITRSCLPFSSGNSTAYYGELNGTMPSNASSYGFMSINKQTTSGFGSTYGLYVDGENSSFTNYGLFSQSSGPATNYAGYFQSAGTGSSNFGIFATATDATATHSDTAGSFRAIASGSANNTAGLFNASGATGNNLAIDVSAGNVRLTPLTASLPLQLDSNKFLISAAISLSTAAVGTLQASQFPALTGDIATSAGSLATTAAATQANIKTFSGPITHTSSTTFNGTVVHSTDVYMSTGSAVGFDEYQNGSYVAIATVTWQNGNKQVVTLTANTTMNFIAPDNSGSLILRLATGAGSFTVTWPGSVLWSGGTAPTITATASKNDICAFYYSKQAAKYYGTCTQNF